MIEHHTFLGDTRGDFSENSFPLQPIIKEGFGHALKARREIILCPCTFAMMSTNASGAMSRDQAVVMRFEMTSLIEVTLLTFVWLSCSLTKRSPF